MGPGIKQVKSTGLTVSRILQSLLLSTQDNQYMMRSQLGSVRNERTRGAHTSLTPKMSFLIPMTSSSLCFLSFRSAHNSSSSARSCCSCTPSNAHAQNIFNYTACCHSTASEPASASLPLHLSIPRLPSSRCNHLSRAYILLFQRHRFCNVSSCWPLRCLGTSATCSMAARAPRFRPKDGGCS